jgi:Tol biopolymer transport system component
MLTPQRLGVAMACAAGVLLGLFAMARFNLPRPPPDPRMTPITFDPGVTTTPALSPDGRLLAYASDRASAKNLDLYVQIVGGENPARLTWTDADESDPSFSPDGSAIAYYSARTGGGIYLIPALGGTPQLLAIGGHNPRFSPVGNVVAYWTGLRNMPLEGQSKSWVIPIAGGGAARQIRPDFPATNRPVWSPDGRRLILWGVAPGQGPAADRTDFWVTGVESDRAVSAKLAGPVGRAGGTLESVEDMTWTAHGLLFSMRAGWVRNLYLCRMNAEGKAVGELIRLTNGTQNAGYPGVSRDGQLVFASGGERFDVWGLSLGAGQGKAVGGPFRITNSTAPAEYPAISADGRKVLFASPRNGTSQIWVRDLTSGEETVAVAGPNASMPLWLRDGRIGYRQKVERRAIAYLVNPQTAESRKVYEGGGLWDVDRSATLAVAEAGEDISAVELNGGKTAVILRAPPAASLSEAHFSPDDRWLVFLSDTGPAAARIYTARADGMKGIPQIEWVPVTDGRSKVNKPRFSPDGQFIYYTEDRDGSRSIRAVRFDGNSGRAPGESFAVWDGDVPRLGLFGVSPGSLAMGLARNKLVTVLAESTSNLWVTHLNQ